LIQYYSNYNYTDYSKNNKNFLHLRNPLGLSEDEPKVHRLCCLIYFVIKSKKVKAKPQWFGLSLCLASLTNSIEPTKDFLITQLFLFQRTESYNPAFIHCYPKKFSIPLEKITKTGLFTSIIIHHLFCR